MPLASILAAIAGVAMLFWRKTVSAVRAACGHLTRGVSRLFGRS